MNSIFCHTCGTLIAENQAFCPACGRAMDWRSGTQPNYYIPSEQQKKETRKKAAVFPESIFSEQTGAAISEEQTTEVAVSAAETQEDFPQKRWLLQEPEQQNPPAALALSFGEMVLLILCAFIPVLGTVILAIASFVGQTQQNINRQTAAKALLLAQLVVLLTVVIFVVFFLPYMMLLLPLHQFPINW